MTTNSKTITKRQHEKYEKFLGRRCSYFLLPKTKNKDEGKST
jgi:hypothetical protein